MSKSIYHSFRHHRRPGVAGRVPLPGSALANHTFDGFGSKCFVKVTEDQETESEEMKEYFPDDEESTEDE